MNYRELIEKLKTYPETDGIKLYCPINKSHYTVYCVLDSHIMITPIQCDDDIIFYYDSVIYLIDRHLNLDSEVIFKHHDTKFEVI